MVFCLKYLTTINYLNVYHFSRFDVDGKFLISGAEDGQVFVVDGRATKDFAGIGYTGNAIIKP